MRPLYVTFKETKSDSTDDGEFRESWLEFWVKDVYTARPADPYHEQISGDVIDGEKCFIVSVIYRDGGTFGMTHGYGSIEAAVLTREEAARIEKIIRENKWISPHGYIKWDGYFSDLEDVKIDEAVVIDNEESL